MEDPVMTGNQDANIKLLYATDANSFFTADTVDNGAQFDIIANVEIGPDLMQIIDKEELFVSVLNVSQSTPIVPTQKLENKINPDPNAQPLNQELRVQITGWTANEGDVLEAVATYKVTAGAFTDVSTARTGSVVVVLP
jgi:hypothetical protein